MIDINKDGLVDYNEFKIFWIHFIEIYSMANQDKLQYEENLIKYAFN